MGDVTVRMGVLSGDTTGDGHVNASDVAQTKSQSGQAVSAANFRQDVNSNGALNASDVSLVKLRSGTRIALGAKQILRLRVGVAAGRPR